MFKSSWCDQYFWESDGDLSDTEPLNPLRPPYGVPVDILAFSHKILFTEEHTNISIVNGGLWHNILTHMVALKS